MIMSVNIKEQYLPEFEKFVKTLPDDAIEVKKSLDDEIHKRSQEYRSGKTKTVPFGTGFDRIREKLVSQL